MLKILSALTFGAAVLVAAPASAGNFGAFAPSGDVEVFLPAASKALKGRTVKPLGFAAPGGGGSRWVDNCQWGNDGIAHCDECDVDWDQNPPQKICITNAVCYDHYGQRIDCP